MTHVKPEGASFDDLHKGDEGTNVADVSEDSATKSLEMLKSISSTGYLRKRLPQELMTLKPSAEGAPMALDITTEADAVVTESVAAPVTTMDERTKAKMQGYEGEACGDCGNYTLVRNGTCMKCNTCGATSGCS